MSIQGTPEKPLATRIAFITMGCAKNEVDSSEMALKLTEAGYHIENDATIADVVIVNTCSFIQEATEESIDAILSVCDLPRVREGSAGIIVAGCMPARYKNELNDALPEVQSFVPCADEQNIVERVNELLLALNLNCVQGELIDSKVLQQNEPFAYVKISDGCDRFCSYCTIPFIRGRYHSFTYETIKMNVKRAQDSGAREIVLIAQDTGRWGQDFAHPRSLASLLEQLVQDYPNLWFRVMYIQPEGISDELIDVVAAYDTICSYFDIPFQQVSSPILESMNRKGSFQDYKDLIKRIRERIPEVTLRTTLMVGFPGESDEDFELLKTFVEEAELDYVGLFAYSREEGTRADRLSGHLPEDIKQVRLQELRDVADTVSSTVISRRIGKEVSLLVWGQEEDGQWFGRTQAQAPEVDGVTYFDPDELTNAGNKFGGIGDIITIRIEDTLLYEMEGTVLHG